MGVLALHLSSAETVRTRLGGEDPVARPARRRDRLEFTTSPPSLPSDRTESAIADELSQVLSAREGESDLRVASHSAAVDPRFLARQAQGRLSGRWADRREGRMYVASLRLADGTWATARTIAPPRPAGMVRGIAAAGAPASLVR